MDNAAGDAAPCTYVQNLIGYDIRTSCAFFAAEMCFFRGKSVYVGISMVKL